MEKAKRNPRHRMTALVLVGVVAGMGGLTMASAPLYRLFCQVTGFSGTPQTVDVAAPTSVSDAVVSVRFDANVNSALPWRFKPAQREVEVQLGEEVLAFYTAENLSDQPVRGTATFNVTPFKAAPYFSKMECFCFTEQILQPGEKVDMPVLFYVDPALVEDEEANEVRKITLSYTFYPMDGEDQDDTETGADKVAGKDDNTGGDQRDG